MPSQLTKPAGARHDIARLRIPGQERLQRPIFIVLQVSETVAVNVGLDDSRRYADAEAVQLDANRDVDRQSGSSARDVKASITGLVQLYEAWGKGEAAAAFRARLSS